MQPIEITQLDENGDVKSASLPALHQPDVGTVPGPDVIVGELIGLEANGSLAPSTGRSASPWGPMRVTKGPIVRGLVLLCQTIAIRLFRRIFTE